MANDYTVPTVPQKLGEGGTGFQGNKHGSAKVHFDDIKSWMDVAKLGLEIYRAVAAAGPTSGSAISVTDMTSTDNLEFVLGADFTSGLLRDRTSDMSIRGADGYLLASTNLSGESLLIIWTKSA